MNLLVLFIVCNVVNVVISTIKSITTVKGTPIVAATMNALAYGFYTYIIVITANFEVSTIAKMIIVALANLVGVYVVKILEKRARKDKLWKIELTVRPSEKEKLEKGLKDFDISYSWIDVNKYILFNTYCETQKESQLVKEMADRCHAKYFVSETKEA